jgi:hypothetical protein
MYEDPATGETVQKILRTNYTHDALIDLIISNPAVDQRELARKLGYSEGWISTIMASDSFQSAFDRRRDEIIDPVLRHSCEEQFKSLVLHSAAILRRKLEANPTDHLALEVMKNASRAMGYGAKIKVDADVRHTHSLVAVLASLPTGPREQRTIDQAADQPAVGRGQILPPVSDSPEPSSA